MTAELTEPELEAITAAASALPPLQRAAFCRRVTNEVDNLPTGTL